MSRADRQRDVSHADSALSVKRNLGVHPRRGASEIAGATLAEFVIFLY